MLGVIARRIFGSANDRLVKSLGKDVAAINALEPEIETLSDEALQATTFWPRRSRPCAKPASARSASAISTCS